MNCQLLNVGSKDLANGLAFIQELQQAANFPFISANISLAGNSDLLFAPSAIIETHDMKLGFVGVSTGNSRVKDFKFSDPVLAAQKAIEQIKSQVDLVILLANVDDPTERELLSKVEGVDFLIRSQTARRYQKPKLENNIVVIRNGNQGKYAGVLQVKIDKLDGPLKDISAQQKRIKFADNRLNAMRTNIEEGVSLEQHYAGDEKRLELITRLRSERADNVNLISKLSNTYYFDPIALDEKIADTPEVAEIVREFMVDHTVVKEDVRKAKPTKG